jgi:hypothetical protein
MHKINLFKNATRGIGDQNLEIILPFCINIKSLSKAHEQLAVDSRLGESTR